MTTLLRITLNIALALILVRMSELLALSLVGRTIAAFR